MKINITHTTSKLVEETINQELLLPYYGRNPQGSAMVSIQAQMWPHLPEKVQRLVVTEACSLPGKGSQLKLTHLDVPAANPLMPVAVLAFLGKYPQPTDAANVLTHTEVVIQRVRQGH